VKRRRLRVAAVCLAIGLLTGAPASLARDGPTTRPALAARTVDIPKVLISFEMVRLPGGTVALNDAAGKTVERKVAPVWMATNEVRWSHYTPYWTQVDLAPEARGRGAENYSRPSKPYSLPHFSGDDFPACGVSSLSASSYCAWLSKLTGKRFRLPTEAEWVYACRAGRAGAVDAKALANEAWFAENSDGEPHACGSKPANAWGLHDMAGNIGEWITRPGEKGEEMVVAGGSFLDGASAVGEGAREAYSPRWQRDDPSEPKSKWWLCNGFHVGLRVVMEDDQ
jgi:formylglycine-generating enzyme required for sulfatase activity